MLTNPILSVAYEISTLLENTDAHFKLLGEPGVIGVEKCDIRSISKFDSLIP
jgi:hypothetical protein